MNARPTLTILAASGVESRRRHLQRARRRLQAMGYEVTQDASVEHRHQRFAGTDAQRLDTLHRVADQAPNVALACRGGYGLSRLLDAIDWARIARSVDAGTRWVGYSDWTAFQLALLAHTGRTSWHGPMAAEDFGRERGTDPVVDDANDVTCESFLQAMDGSLEAVGFRTGPGRDGLTCQGRLWGGNLSMVCSLLGTAHWPEIEGGILFLEDVGEHPYRVERLLLQLLQAGVLARQSAVLLGSFTGWKPSPLDRGYRLESVWRHLEPLCAVPLLTGLPIGHTPLNLPLPQGAPCTVWVEGRTAYLSWADDV